MKSYQIQMCTDHMCTRSNPCAACRAAPPVLKDGEGVRVRMMMMDSVQREIAALPTSQELRPGQAAIDAAKRAATSLQDAVDEAMRQHEQREAALRHNGYHRSLPGYQASDADTAGGTINEFAASDLQKQALENARKRARERQKHGYHLTAYEKSLL